MVNIDRIKELAKEKGIKIKYICSQLGLAETYLSNVKNGKDRMTDERLQKIADILDTTVEYLTGETDEKKKPPVETEGEYDKDEDFKAFSKVLGDLTPEELQKVLSYAEFVLKQRNP